MAKLPKKKTMLETTNRVEGYANKLYMAGKITFKQYGNIQAQLSILKNAIDK